MQLNELDEIHPEAYQNSMFYKEKTKRFHYSSIARKEFIVDPQVLLYNSRLGLWGVSCDDQSGLVLLLSLMFILMVQLKSKANPPIKASK